MTRKKAKVIAETPAGEGHQVITVEGDKKAYRRRPCDECPWRKDQVGKFPAEAFRISANTAYDMATHVFACHMAKKEFPATCAGFLLRGADHNMSIRLSLMEGRISYSLIDDGGVELHDSYRDMAIANGVAADDPVLENCR